MSTIMHHKALTIALMVGLAAASAGAYPLERIVAGKLPIFQSVTATDAAIDDQVPPHVGSTPLIYGSGDLEADF
jgi:hypothetical protein